MLGVVFGLVWFAIYVLMYTSGAANLGVQSATHAMLWWYGVWAAVQAVIVTLMVFGGLGATAFARKTDTKLSGLGVGGVGLLLGLVFGVRSFLLLLGTYFIYTAGAAGAPFTEWNTTQLFIGGAMLGLTALFWQVKFGK
jgi:hypothetical protein